MSNLTQLQIRELLLKLPEWSIQEGRLEKTYVFPDFSRAIIFVNKMVNPIEENQHYPKVTISYNRVTVSLITIGQNVVTARDIMMAKEIDALI